MFDAQNILIVLAVIFIPWFLTWLTGRVKILGTLGAVFLCYITGIALSFVFSNTNAAVTLSELLIPISIPLILFSADLSTLQRLAKPMLVSYLLVIISVMVAATAGFFIFQSTIHEAENFAGMTIGLYTGGTPNLNAIGKALSVADESIVIANASDMVVGGLYFFMLISFLPRFVHKFYNKFKDNGKQSEQDDRLLLKLVKDYSKDGDSLSLRDKLNVIPLILLSILCLGAAAGLALLITGELDVAVIMLVVTTLGVALSFVRGVRDNKASFAAGQYFIYMFSIAIGICFDLSFLNAEALKIAEFICFVQFASIILHMILAKFTKTDGDTLLITSTAGIFGPAFIMPVANALSNRKVILPGIICGILGYAIGNYLGIGMAWLLKLAA